MNPTYLFDRQTLEKHQLMLIKKILKQTLENNNFYQNKYKNIGITSRYDINSLSDFRKLPFTTKEELIKDQKLHPPLGTNFSIKNMSHTGLLLKSTSGTSGSPTLITPYTQDDIVRRGLYASVPLKDIIRPQPDDIAMFYMNHGAFVYGYHTYNTMGLKQISPLTNRVHTLHEIINRQVTILNTTLTSLIQMTEIAQEHGIDLKVDSRVRLLICSGEPGVNNPTIKKYMDKIWHGDYLYNAGSSESGNFAIQCLHKQDMHILENVVLAEVIDPVTGKPANKGELILTPLWKHDSPLIRYRTGDIVELNRTKCSCGLCFNQIKNSQIVRIKSVLQVNDKSIFPHNLDNQIRKIVGISEYQLELIHQNDQDTFHLYLETNNPSSALIKRLKNVILKVTQDSPIYVSLIPKHSLERKDWKTVRIIDSRKDLSSQKLILNLPRQPSIHYLTNYFKYIIKYKTLRQ